MVSFQLHLFVGLSLLCLAAEALAPSRLNKSGQVAQRAETSQISPQEVDSETPAFSRRNLFKQAGAASASMFLSSIGFSNPLPAQAAETLDDYLVSGISKKLSNPWREE